MSFLQRVMQIFIRLTGILIGFFLIFVPRNKNIWVFDSWFGEQYSDNSKYLFEYVKKNHPDIRIVWLTKSERTLELIRGKGHEAYLTDSLKGTWTFMRAELKVNSDYRKVDLSALIPFNRIKIVQLWHGIPLKKIIFDDKLHFYKFSENIFLSKLKFLKNKFFSSMTLKIKTFLQGNYTLVIAASEEDKKNFSSAFNMSSDKIKVTGYPRNDALFSKEKERSEEVISGIYMPTFRGEAGKEVDLFEKFGFDIKKLENFLKEAGIYLYLRLHPANMPPPRIEEQIKTSEFIKYHREMDVYESINRFSFLITDYSSIYFDYLLLDRPIIFAPFDIESYIDNERELYYDYDQVTPGPKARNWDEVMRYIKESIDFPGKYKDERSRVRDMFHKYKDGNSGERVYREIIKSFEIESSRK